MKHRNKKELYVVTSFRLPPKLQELAQKISEQIGMTVSEYIRHLLINDLTGRGYLNAFEQWRIDEEELEYQQMQDQRKAPKEIIK